MNDTTEVATTLDQRYRILIVDDDDDVREALQDELELTYDVTAVSTGRDAIGRLDMSHFDAIISDQRMPGMSGVEVLAAAHELDNDLVRILLTGYLDEDARKATMEVDAPYKIGKPWHDEVEVTLKRAFEHRSRERSLTGSVNDALAVAGIDGDIASVEGSASLGNVLVRRCLKIEGVCCCQVVLRSKTSDKHLAGKMVAPPDSKHWNVDLAISSDGQLRLLAMGRGMVAKEIVSYIASRALHWNQEAPAVRMAQRAHSNKEVKERLNTVSRRATLGTMTTALVHELASMVQGLQGALYHMEDFIREAAKETEDEEVLETLENAVETSSRMVSLFRAMRTFVRSGDTAHRPCSVQALIDHSVTLCRGSLRAVVDLDISPLPDVFVDVNEPLFLQVIVNLLKNAAEASELNATIHIYVEQQEDNVCFAVRDHGPGVPPDLVEEIFEPFTTTKSDHTASGLGLAISSEIVSEHGGTICYKQAEDGGAIFLVTVPIALQ